MERHRGICNLLMRGATLLILLVSFTSGCNAAQAPQSPSIDNEVMVFGAKIGTLVRTIQTAALFIQAELAKPQPNLHDMQEAHARIKTAYLDLSKVGPTPKELYDLNDLWITASFDCDYSTNLAIINGAGDLSTCLAEIDAVVKATAKYMPAQGEATKPIP
jgi:hypothetical protein